MMEAYLQLLIKMYEFFPEKIRQEMASNLYADIHKGISILTEIKLMKFILCQKVN